MRKKSIYILSVLLIAGLMFLLVACGAKDNGNAANNHDIGKVNNNNNISNAGNSKAEEDVTQAANENLYGVEITIPAILLVDDDPELIKTEMEEEEGIDEVIINSDGSLTYIMSEEAQKRLLDETKTYLETTIDDIVNNDVYPSIMDIKVNESYTEFTLIVDKENYENDYDEAAAFELGWVSMFYQAFAGADAETMEVTIHIQDSATGEIFNTIVYPDVLNDAGY